MFSVRFCFRSVVKSIEKLLKWLFGADKNTNVVKIISDYIVKCKFCDTYVCLQG